jgi:hypothetical protein
MSANPVRPLVEPISPISPVAADPTAATGAPTPQQMLALLQRAAAETSELRERLLALSNEIDSAAQRLIAHFGDTPRLTAVDPRSAAAPTPPVETFDPATPAVSVAVEMAVAGFTRDEVRGRLTGAFGIADPGPIVEHVFNHRI